MHRQLRSSGCVPTETDGEIVVQCFQAWGTRAFERLIGDFAFLLWNQTARVLYCVRDALGLRSAFYHRDRHRLLLASSIGELLDWDPSIPTTVAKGCAAAYLAGERLKPSATFLSAIHQIPAGHWLEVNREGVVRVERHWDPSSIALVQNRSADDVAVEFRDLFLESVHARLPAPSTRIGFHVSGGFDSSAVVAATWYWNNKLSLGLLPLAISNLGHEPSADERVFIDAMLDRYPMPQVTTRSEDFWAFKQPQGNEPVRDEPYLAPHFARFINELNDARESGIQAIYSGTGGDEIGGSSMYLVDYLCRGYVWSLWRELRGRAAGRGIAATALLRTVASYALGSLFGRLRDRPVCPPNWLRQELLSSLDEEFLRGGRMPIRRGPAREHLFRALEICWNEPLLSNSIAVSRRFGIDLHYPFFDRRLFEWALSVPPFRFGENGRVKAPMRKALRDLLPESIVNRSDKGRYGYYFDLGLREKERPRILEYLRDPITAQLGYIDPEPLRSAYEEYCRGGSIQRGPFWNWLTLEQWLRSRTS